MSELRKRMLVEGMVAGVLGYVVVAVFFVVVNVSAGRSPVYTAALAGEATFGGLRDAAGMTMDPGLVLAFNGVQLVVLLAFGFLAAWLMYATEMRPALWYVTFFAFLAATVAGSGAVVAATVLSGRLISPWLVMGAGLVAVAGMMTYLIASHRPLLRRIRASPGGAVDGIG